MPEAHTELALGPERVVRSSLDSANLVNAKWQKSEVPLRLGEDMDHLIEAKARLRRFSVAMFAITAAALLGAPVYAQQSPCDSVLGDGVFDHQEWQNSQYTQIVLAARLSQMTYQQAKRYTDSGLSVGYGDFTLGGNYSEDDFNTWQQNIKSSLDVNQIISNQSSVLLTSGDKGVLGAWQNCISQSGGLTFYIEPRDKHQAVINIEWNPYPTNKNSNPRVTGFALTGAQVIDGTEYTKKGTMLGIRYNRIITIARNPSGGAVLATLRTNLGDRTAYLPVLPQSIRFPSFTWAVGDPQVDTTFYTQTRIPKGQGICVWMFGSWSEQPVEPNRLRVGPLQPSSGAIQLSPRALYLLSHPEMIDTFNKECGDGFIAVLIQGGELIGTITIQDFKQADASSLNLAVSADLYGQQAEGTVDNAVTSAMQGHTFTADIMETGGSGNTTPIKQDALLVAIAALPTAAQKAPIPFTVVVRSYQTLSNWPQISLPTLTSNPLNDIMSMYWRLDALIQEAGSTAKWACPLWQAGWPCIPNLQSTPMYFGINGSPQLFTSLAIDANKKRTMLAQQAQDCVKNNICNPPQVTEKNFYALAVQLLLPWSDKVEAVTEFNTRYINFA